MSDAGQLHKRPATWGKAPARLLHDTNVTDGAVRLYAHMHWRYGQNQDNHEGQRSMAETLGVSEKTIGNRVKELEAKDWIVVIERGINEKTGNYLTNFYHVFERQRDGREFRLEYTPREGERLRSKPAARARKSRKGVGGNPLLIDQARQNSSSAGIHQNSSSAHPPNSSSANTDSVDPESLSITRAREQFRVFIPADLALKVDPLTFPAAVNAIFYAYLDALADPRVNRVPASMMTVLWEQLRDSAMGIAAAKYTAEQVTAYIIDEYTAPGKDYWRKIDAAIPLKNVANNLPGYVVRKTKQAAKSSFSPQPAPNSPSTGARPVLPPRPPGPPIDEITGVAAAARARMAGTPSVTPTTTEKGTTDEG